MDFKLGSDYYPEHRTSEEVDRDIRLMREAGLNVVRLAEFAWSKYEPAEGVYRFDWLDEVVDKFQQAGISCLICTPTACPPAWMIEKHPDILYKDNRGIIRPFGGRRHYCYNNSKYREYARKIASGIARHYKNRANVIGFHIDNELAQEGTGRCCCDVCITKFREWLEKKYGTIEALNTRMGTIFWSQVYDHFGQINPPIIPIEVSSNKMFPMYYDNPSLRLDFERFCSESLIAFQNVQTAAIKAESDLPATTNSTGLATNSIDYYEAYRELDVYALDIYPDLRSGTLDACSFAYAHARAVKPDRKFWIVEIASGGGQAVWSGQGVLQPHPGALMQEAIHAFVSGAELLTYFPFVTFAFGAEQLEQGILDLDGIPRRRYYEIQETAKRLEELEPILMTSRRQHEVAVCFDYETLWSLRIKPIHAEFDYLNLCGSYFDLLRKQGIGLDVVSCSAELDDYKVVIVPAPIMMTDGFKIKLKSFAAKGGTIVTTFLAAVKDPDNIALRQSLPGGLADLFGVRVTEVEPVYAHTIVDVRLLLDGGEVWGKNKYWTESLESIGAELIGTYENSFRKGEGIVARNRYFDGLAYYVGSHLDDAALSALLRRIMAEQHVSCAPFAIQEGMEVLERKRGAHSIYFVFNYRQSELELNLTEPYHDLLSGERYSGMLLIPPKGFVALML